MSGDESNSNNSGEEVIDLQTNKFIAEGKRYGCSGKELMDFVGNKWKIYDERNERALERLERQEELKMKERQRKHELDMQEIELKKLEIEAARVKHMNTSQNDDTNVSSVNVRMKIPEYKGGCFDSFLQNFEDILKANKITDEKHFLYLRNALHNHECASVFMSLPSGTSYKEIKRELLNYFNLTAEDYRKKFRYLKHQDQSSIQLWGKMEYLSRSWYSGAGIDLESSSILELHELYLKEQFMRMLDPNLCLRLKENDYYSMGKDKILNMAQVHMSTHKVNRKVSVYEKGKENRTEGKEDNRTCYKCNEVGHIAPNCKYKQQSNGKEKASNNKVKTQVQVNLVRLVAQSVNITRSEEVSAEMTTQVARGKNNSKKLAVYIEDGKEFAIKKGTVNGKAVNVLRDTGCNAIVIDSKLVESQQWVDKKISVKLLGGLTIEAPVARVNVDCEYLKGIVEAICVQGMNNQVLIGNVKGTENPFETNVSDENCDISLEDLFDEKADAEDSFNISQVNAMASTEDNRCDRLRVSADECLYANIEPRSTSDLISENVGEVAKPWDISKDSSDGEAKPVSIKKSVDKDTRANGNKSCCGMPVGVNASNFFDLKVSEKVAESDNRIIEVAIEHAEDKFSKQNISVDMGEANTILVSKDKVKNECSYVAVAGYCVNTTAKGVESLVKTELSVDNCDLPLCSTLQREKDNYPISKRLSVDMNTEIGNIFEKADLSADNWDINLNDLFVEEIDESSNDINKLCLTEGIKGNNYGKPELSVDECGNAKVVPGFTNVVNEIIKSVGRTEFKFSPEGVANNVTRGWAANEAEPFEKSKRVALESQNMSRDALSKSQKGEKNLRMVKKMAECEKDKYSVSDGLIDCIHESNREACASGVTLAVSKSAMVGVHGAEKLNVFDCSNSMGIPSKMKCKGDFSTKKLRDIRFIAKEGSEVRNFSLKENKPSNCRKNNIRKISV